MTRHSAKELRSAYRKIKPRIKKRLAEFRRLRKSGPRKIFSELSFCILTANANAVLCDRAIKELVSTGLLFNGRPRQIRPRLRGRVRFHNKKASYIVCARSLAGNKMKDILNLKDVFAIRDWLVQNIKGFGYKEASHFLRNIGLGKDIAILDRHILKNLKKYGVIDSIPASVGSRALYLGIEDKMRKFSKKISIPFEELDLLFWSLQTGFVFK